MKIYKFNKNIWEKLSNIIKDNIQTLFIYNKGDKAFYKNNKLSRENYPALKLVKGNYHRDDGPAIELYNGDKKWLKKGKLHREDGPAVEYPNGSKEFWLNGKRIK